MSSTQTKQIKERSTRPLQSQNGNSDPQSINKIQPTGEQLRIAQITSSDRADVDPEMLKKIKEVSDLTGKSTDEAWTALHDCNGDANQAVELIFEKEGEQDEWQEKKKRKKPTTVVPINRVTQQTTTMSDNAATDTRQERMTDNDIIDRSENIPRGQQRDRAPPRFQRGRGRGFNHSGANGEKDVSASRERGPDRRFEGGRGRRGGGGGGGLGGRGGGRGGEGGGLAGRGRGGRGYNSNSVGMETAPHIDTWTNETAQNGRNNDTSIGAWGDTTTEEWTADEWSGSLEESLVLTRSMPSRSDVFSGAAAAAGASSSSDVSQQQHQQQQHPQQQQQGLQSQVFVPSSHAAGEVMTDNMTSSGYLSSTLPPNADQNSGRSVGFDLNHLLPKFSSEPYSSMTRDDESAAYLSHYTKKATECIKNAVGIGSSTMSGSSSHGDASSSSNVVDQMGRRPTTVAQSSSNAAQQIPLPNRVKQQQQQQMPPHHQHHHPHQQQQQQQMPQQQQQQHRPRLPPPSKIPSSAVEMPGSMGSAQLDVQFGNWDSSSSASASSSSAAPPPAIDASNAFLNDSSSSQTHLSSQFSAQQNINNARDQSSAMNLGGGGKTTTTTMVGVGGSDNMSLQHNKASGHGSMNDASSSSSSSAVLAMQQEMTIGGSKPTSTYQTNAGAAAAGAQPNELGNSNKMMANPAEQQQQQQQQLLSSFPTSSDDRKTIPYASQQPSNQLSGPSGSSLGSSSQLGLSQLAYSSGVESAPPSVYKPSSSSSAPGASSSSAYSSQQPSAVSGATAPYGSTLHYPTTGPQAQMHLNYPVAPGAANQGGVYSAYSVAEQQANFSNTAPVSYGAMATQAPTGFSGASKPYGSVADKSSNQFPASVLSQVYESTAMGNAYPTGNQQGAGMQMGYQSTGAIYPGQGGAAAVGLSYEGLPAVSSTSAYQNPANLYRGGGGGGGGGQMPTNVTNDFQSSISESSSYPRVVQTVASTAAAPQSSSTPGGSGKLSDGLSKMSVKDSSVISQQPTSYEPSSASATSASSLSSSSSNAGAANAGNVSSSVAAGSTLKTMAPATTKSTAASKTAMNWPPSAVPAPMMNVNPNYMISQPPGFQLATFGYPTAQQTLPYSYEDLQILQQRYALPAAYYDLPLQSSALPGRDLQASLTSASYVPGSDVKLAALMEPQVSVAQQQQQQQGPSAGANQQQSYPAAAAAAAAMHPGYSYYYPPAAGMVPYYTPMIPVGGVAVPMVTNPTHGATTSSTQYQKPTLYGSHAFGAGGPSQDFSKTFNPQASVKVTGTASGITPSDMIAAGNAFGKSHVQGFDKVGFHSGTPPPTSFSLALATGTQGGALGQPAIYGTPYMPMMPHQQQQQQQQTHSQLMHHAMAAQDSSMASRGLAQQQQQQANALQQQQAKVGSNKTYANPYWAGGN